MDDNGKVLWDSHVISAYLVDKYGKDDSLYPKDLFIRAKVTQRLFFDAGSLFPKLRNAIYPILFENGGWPTQYNIDEIYKVLDILEKFLATDPYLVGDKYTIADISVANTVLIIPIFAPITDKYPKISAWLERVNSNIPHFAEINGDYVNISTAIIKDTVEKNKSQ